jgi:outer membrane protein assembly factor BamB
MLLGMGLFVRLAMRKAKPLLIVIVCLLILPSCFLSVALGASDDSSAEWPMFRQNPSRNGTTTTDSQANSAQLLWKYPTSASVWSSPAVADGVVIVGCKDCHIYCLNASSGEQIWNFPTGHEVNSSPAISNGFVYVGCDDGWVYCLNVTSGMPPWISWVGGYVRSSPAVVDGYVYIGSGLHNFYCLNASTGDVVWAFPTQYLVDSSPAVLDGVVYVSTDDFHLYALNASTGQQLWRQYTGGNLNSPCVSGGYIYIGAYDGWVSCLNASTGAVLWRNHTEDTVGSSAAVAYGRVYIGSEDGSLYCLNATNGEKLWQVPTGYWVWSSPTVANGNVFVSSQDYNIYCIDAFTGAVKWRYETGSMVDSSPSIVDDVLYVGSHDQHVYALRLSNSTTETVEAAASTPWTTLLFDALMIAAWTTVLALIIRHLYTSRKNKKTQTNPDPNQPWLLKHINTLCAMLILSFAVVFFLSLSGGPLWAADEKTYSQMAYHMVRSGDYFLPWAFGEPAIWIGKPPLLMWLMSFSYQILGVTNFASRVWMPLFGVASLVAVYFLGKKLYNAEVGVLSVLVLGTFSVFFGFATHAMTDMPLVFFMLASVYFLLLSQEKQPTRNAVLSGVFFGLALMTKQLEALLIPLILVVYFLLTRRSVRFLFTKRFALSWGVAAAIFLPWVLYMNQRFKDFWDCYFTYANVSRLVSPLEGHTGDFFFYFHYLLVNEPVWAVLLPFAAALCIYNIAVKRSKADTLILCWMIIVLALFTFAQTKIYWYILPATPAFALAIANLLYQTAAKLLHNRKPKISFRRCKPQL